MDTATTLWHCLPYLAAAGYGVYTVAEVFIPSLRDSQFNRWEIDDNSGSYIEIMGWRKVLTPPRVIAQGYLSDRTACAIALAVGAACIGLAFMGIRHVAGIPESFPDVLSRM